MASRRIGTVSAPKVDWDLLKDQAAGLAQIQEGLTGEARRTVEGILNLLAALRPTSERHNRREAAGLAQIQHFRRHLDSDKFKGTETVCRGCHRVVDPAKLQYGNSPCCTAPVDVEAKDWISVTDVLNWLRTIEDHLKYDAPEVIDRG